MTSERDKPPQKSSMSSKLQDKANRRIRIVVTDSNGGTQTNYRTIRGRDKVEPKNTNVDYNGDYDMAKTLTFCLDGSGRSKNDKNWENWERIREQKLERMKNICFESYRQSKRDKMHLAKPKPRQLDPTWYTDNIYSNRSEDLDDEYVPDCLKYGRIGKLRNIRENDELFVEDEFVGTVYENGGGTGSGGMRERRGEGEGSAGYGLQRSISCKEFHYPKSQSCSFVDRSTYDEGLGASPPPPAPSAPSIPHAPMTSILKNKANVPKSYSFSASTKTTPFDVMDYEVPPSLGKSRRERQEAFRKSMGYHCSNSLDEAALSCTQEMHLCCAREHCTSAKCLLDDIYSESFATAPRRPWRRIAPSSSSTSGFYGAGVRGGSNRNLHDLDWWEDRSNHRVATASRYSLLSGSQREQPLPPPPTVICCCAADDYCYHRQQQYHMVRSMQLQQQQQQQQPPLVPRSRYHCPSHHPAAEEEEHMHCRAMAYDTDLDHFIRDERERLLLQDKFLDEDERYLSGAPRCNYNTYRRPTRSKSLLEVQPPSRYDEDTCSDTTEMDLQDFNIDLEKYWEELEKPPSPVDLDMQRRNMHSNLKVKNVNVGCYNNGQPIDLHDREQERMMIKKSLLEGMPSPPQVEHHSTSVPLPTDANSASNTFHFFEHAGSPLQRTFNYGHKVYPAAETLPTYQYNNFYPEDVQTQQPTSSGHHPSASGHSALNLINNIFSIYKPNKYAAQNSHYNNESKPEPCKKMNVPSTRRPLGAPHSQYMHSMKRPLIVSTEQPHFKIIPEKTGLKISPFYNYNDDMDDKPQARLKLTSTARPLMLPH